MNRPLLNLILHDDALTRGLGDEEARILLERVAEWSERQAALATDGNRASRIERVRRRGRAIRQFVELWCHRREHGAAIQLAAAEQMRWPLPDPDADPWELMHHILDWEDGTAIAAA